MHLVAATTDVEVHAFQSIRWRAIPDDNVIAIGEVKFCIAMHIRGFAFPKCHYWR
jgi:hypothetical protein